MFQLGVLACVRTVIKTTGTLYDLLHFTSDLCLLPSVWKVKALSFGEQGASRAFNWHEVCGIDLFASSVRAPSVRFRAVPCLVREREKAASLIGISCTKERENGRERERHAATRRRPLPECRGCHRGVSRLKSIPSLLSHNHFCFVFLGGWGGG